MFGVVLKFRRGQQTISSKRETQRWSHSQVMLILNDDIDPVRTQQTFRTICFLGIIELSNFDKISHGPTLAQKAQSVFKKPSIASSTFFFCVGVQGRL